jgi:hypothetical protein
MVTGLGVDMASQMKWAALLTHGQTCILRKLHQSIPKQQVLMVLMSCHVGTRHYPKCQGFPVSACPNKCAG